MLVPDRPFQPNQMFVGEASSLPYSGAPERSFAQIHSSLLIRLCWKGLPVTKALSFSEQL